MRKKALVIIAIYLALIVLSSNEQYNDRSETYQFVLEDGEDLETKIIEILNSKEHTTKPSTPQMVTLDLTSPSYTSISLSETEPIAEGTEVNLQSTTTSMGMGVDSGNVDFKDLELYKVENDTTSDSIFSNRFGIRINIPQTVTIYGFLIDIAPTIREDVNFYIRESLEGTDLKTGVVSGYLGNSAQVNDQLLHVLFSYSAGGGSLVLSATNDYYFILEPSSSSSSTFFEMRQSDNTMDDVGVFNWTGSIYEEIVSDVNIYLITDENTIEANVGVNGNGEASCTWTSTAVGAHSILAMYKGSLFYSESFGSCLTTVIPTMETYFVELEPIYTDYQDIVNVTAIVLDDEYILASDKTVFFSYSEDEIIWTDIGSAFTNSYGEATVNYQFDVEPGTYKIKAKVNEFSFNESELFVYPENLVWNTIDFLGNYRNNPLYPDDVKITAMILVKDDDNEIVSNLDFELWYKIDGEYERIPHYYRTDANGLAEIDFSVEGLSVGTFLETHYFIPADYITKYIVNSGFGNTIVDKGYLEIAFSDYSVIWDDDLLLTAQITTLGEGWQNINVAFDYFDNDQWNNIGQVLTNSSGFAELQWNNVNLDAGSYPIRARTTESTLFFAEESIKTVEIERKGIILYIINDGEPKGNGEEIDLEYTSTMNLIFYVTYEDGTPIPNTVIEIKGRLLGDVFYETMGFVTTNATGYAVFNNYEDLTLVGYQYACIAEIADNGQHEEDQLYFKLNLIKCNPILVVSDHIGMIGSFFELTAYVYNSEGLPLMNVQVQFIFNGMIYQGTTDRNGFVRILVAPQIPAGGYQMTCLCIEDDYFNTTQKIVTLSLNKGIPYFTVLDVSVKVNGYLTLKAYVVDSLGRPISGLTVRMSFNGWSELLTADENGLIQYTFSVSGHVVGNYLLVLTFNGDNTWIQASATGNLLIYQNDSEMDLQTGSIIGIYYEEVYFEAMLLTDQGLALEGRLIDFVIFFDNGSYLILGQNTTDLEGIARLRTNLIIVPGNYYWGAIFKGEIDFGPSSDSRSIIVEKASVNLIGSNFDAIVDSTASFSITLLNHLGLPIAYQIIDLYLWSDNSWVLIGSFTTNQQGIAYLTFHAPSLLGVYYLKVQYYGNEFYKSKYLPLEITIVEPPPKISPNMILNVDTDVIADHQIIEIEISIPNAVEGAAVELDVYVNNVYTTTIFIINGIGTFAWNSSILGIFDISLISVEDSVYLVTVKSISIEVIANVPPELISYSFIDYLSEGESFYIETVIQDASGIGSVWFVANGTKYPMVFDSIKYSKIIFMLTEGIYITSIQAEDEQGNIASFELPPLKVHGRKTQVVKYHLNSAVVEQGTQFILEALIYSEKSLKQVFLIINSTEYQMILDYQIDTFNGVWRITVDNLEIGYFEIKIKIVESTDEVYINEIHELLLIIPNTPLINSNEWLIEYDENGDFISGNLTISSYYGIISVQIWIDGIEFTVIKIGEGLYYYYGIVDHAKKHVMKVKVIDSNNRILENEFPLTVQTNPKSLTVSLVVAGIVLLILIGSGLFIASKFIKKNRQEDLLDTQLDISEIEDDEQIIAEVEAQSNVDVSSDIQIESETINDDLFRDNFDLFPRENESPQSQSIKPTVTATMKQKKDSKKKPKVDLVEVPKEDESLKQVKEYLEKVKEDGTLEYANGNGSDKNSDEDFRETIDKLTSFTTEIDYRLLPKDEQLAKLAEEQENSESTVFDLKEITEEIEQTFTKNK
ncbi:MAG TPA: hypothetical protein VMX55_00665 [candidate division Zixibacteria bacterium]|nr:hypothetical protein [candidate division Zixibacteria bacterium]